MHVFIFGLGYTGGRLAELLLQQGNIIVSGTSRSSITVNDWKAKGVNAVMWDSELPLDVSILDGVTHVLTTTQVNVIGGKDPVLSDPNIVSALLSSSCLKWCGYLSTTGVYGNRDGDEVTEESECNASGKRGLRRVLAEQSWIETQLPVHLFRLPGIYGPGRGPLMKLRKGKSRCIVKPGQKFSRVHVADICGAVYASMLSPSSTNPEIYNIVDDLPLEAFVVTQYAANLLGIKSPPLEDYDTAELSAMAKSFYSDNKTVSNKKMKEELKYKLLYPTYIEGLVAQFEEETGLTVDEFKRQQNWNKIKYYCSILIKVIFVLLFFPIASIYYLYKWKQSTKISAIKSTAIFVIDNGSIRPKSTRSLRLIAHKLSLSIGKKVEPVSVRWSDRITPDRINNIKAEVLLMAIEERLRSGIANDFILLPLFFGESETLLSYIPNSVTDLKKQFPELRIRVALPLVDVRDEAITHTVTNIMKDRILHCISENKLTSPSVILVDHGSPSLIVTQVRDTISRQLQSELQCHNSIQIQAASMERREGDEYNFCDPLLEKALESYDPTTTTSCSSEVVVAMLFLSEGKHAGRGGDIEGIIKDSVSRKGGTLKVYTTDTVGNHPLMISILSNRYHEVITGKMLLSC